MKFRFSLTLYRVGRFLKQLDDVDLQIVMVEQHSWEL